MCVDLEKFENLERLFDQLTQMMADRNCPVCKGEGQHCHKYGMYACICNCVKKSLIPIREDK